jgi:hypothetical protein
LYQYIFVNRSWYAGAILTLLTLAIYRIFFVFLLAIVSKINPVAPTIGWKELFSSIGWELLLTSLSVGLVYLFIYHFLIKPSRPAFKRSTFPF